MYLDKDPKREMDSSKWFICVQSSYPVNDIWKLLNYVYILVLFLLCALSPIKKASKYIFQSFSLISLVQLI